MVGWIEPHSINASGINAEVGSGVDALLQEAGHPLVAEILRRRVGEGFKAHALLGGTPVPGDNMPGMEAAVEAILAAGRICVWGDFDVDGQSSTALLVCALRRLGCAVFYYIPDRNSEGHGLNIGGLEKVRREGADLVLTCDCGVGDVPELEAAVKMGLQVVITDHHVPPQPLPPATAIVHPAFLPADDVRSGLCGVGVAYALASALFERRGRSGEEKEWLDYVALGTIADLASLQGVNHTWVRQGLEPLLYQPRPGIAALYRKMAFSVPELPESEVVSFALAPRLNAAGRMAHARLAVELLLCEEVPEAEKMAAELVALNTQRQRVCRRLEAEITRSIAAHPEWASEPALFMEGADWKPGVVGIIASRLARRLGRPVVLVSAPPGGLARASIRSIPGVDVQRAIDRLQDRIERFGGHSMAAGFSIRTAELPTFRRLFLDSIAQERSEAPEPQIKLDAWVEGRELDVELVRHLYRMAPFGAGNPAPVLGWRDVALVNVAALSRHGGDALMLAEDRDQSRVKALWWGTRPGDVPQERVDIAAKVRLDPHGRGERIQLEIVAVRPCARAEPRLIGPNLPFEVADWRQLENPLEALNGLYRDGDMDVQVWSEGQGKIEGAFRRDQLDSGGCLVIWDGPAAPQVLAQVLRRVMPQRVVLVAQAGGNDTPQAFFKALAAVIHTTVQRRAGRASIEELAARLGQRTSTVQAGLDYLVQCQRLFYEQTDGELRLEKKVPVRQEQIPYDTLKHLLQETAAYRRYVRRGSLGRLLGMATEPGDSV
jgi:single-stranded-DNA-specific exonuclease